MALSPTRPVDPHRRRRKRISNFLLWQAAYSELYFSDRLWPDFDEAALDERLPLRRASALGPDLRAVQPAQPLMFCASHD